jgi:hypothetical protein
MQVFSLWDSTNQRPTVDILLQSPVGFEALRRWSFLQRTPEQRLEWLIQMLEIAYASGAIQPRRPRDAGNAR